MFYCPGTQHSAGSAQEGQDPAPLPHCPRSNPWHPPPGTSFADMETANLGGHGLFHQAKRSGNVGLAGQCSLEATIIIPENNIQIFKSRSDISKPKDTGDARTQDQKSYRQKQSQPQGKVTWVTVRKGIGAGTQPCIMPPQLGRAQGPMFPLLGISIVLILPILPPL